MLRRSLFITIMVAGVAAFALAQAQNNGGGAAPGVQERSRNRDGAERRRGGRDRGDADAEGAREFRNRMMDALKQESGSSDQEWAALQPRLAKVTSLQRDLRGGFGGFAGRPGRERGDAAENKVAQATRDLRGALQEPSTSAGDLSARLSALREARQKIRAELDAAQKELKSSLNPRQEAAFVLAGIIE